MLAVRLAGRDPADLRKAAIARGLEELANASNIGELSILLNSVEVGKRIPDSGRAGPLSHRRAVCRVIRTVRLGSRFNIVSPGHMVLMEQISQVGPCIVGGAPQGDWPEVRRKDRAVECIDAAH